MPFSSEMLKKVGLSATMALSFIQPDGGVTWLLQQSPTANHLRDLVQTPSGQLWAIGDATTIIRY